MEHMKQESHFFDPYFIDLKDCFKKYEISEQEQEQIAKIRDYRDCVNYLSAALIYLKQNVLLEKQMESCHIKERLLGHWGTCPGINLVYAHCNYLINKYKELNMMFVLGPGHGAPAILSNLYVSGELCEFYPQYGMNHEGLNKFIRDFSYPGGFPSHVNPQIPGTIHEGGELGYALSVSYGAVMNHPNLMITCLVGDGEAETGPTATAWHVHKFIDPKESGAVLPILHLNGFKISSPTLFGTMSDQDLIYLFTGYGYQVKIVHQLKNIDHEMALAMEWAYKEIINIQSRARNGNPIFKPRWPMIILKSPKGWTGVKSFHGKKIEGSFRSHQVPLKDARNDDESRKALEEWLKSYNVLRFFKNGELTKYIRSFCPPHSRGMASSKYANALPHSLKLPVLENFSVEVKERGKSATSSTLIGGEYLADVFQNNPNGFKIFSPDELESNRLFRVFQKTHRNYQWDEETANKGGGVIEILSEHTCQGLMQGYILTGRYAMFPSYEAFLPIVASMVSQYSKFLKFSKGIKWRNPVPSMLFVQSSTLWRQEHNGFSHQNPSFINTLMNMGRDLVRIYFPPDANCFLSTMHHCLKSRGLINLIISSKLDTPSWLTMEEAKDHCRAGASVWGWCSTDEGKDPDIVFVGCGNEMTTEVIAACYLLREYAPSVRVRIVNLTDLFILQKERQHPHALSDEMFEGLVTPDKPVIFNFHGYPSVVKQLLFGRRNSHRFHVLGYIEEGTTTTPFKMLTSNHVSRYDVAIEAIQMLCKQGHEISSQSPILVSKFQHFLRVHSDYILVHGDDPEEVNGINFLLKCISQKSNEEKKKLIQKMENASQA